VKRRLPPADRNLAFSADAHQPSFITEQARRARASEATRILDSALIERIVLVSLLNVTFAQVLPDVRATNLQLASAVASAITVNTALSHWLARRGSAWAFALRELAVIGAVNLSLVLMYALLAPNFEGSIDLANTLFFALMLTLMVALFDHYRQVYLMRFAPADERV
jgi:sodium--glutamate symport carrier gltS